MRHIRQRNAIDCGLAVISMLSGCRYEEARKADPFPNKTIGLSLSDFIVTLERCSGKKHKFTKPSKYIRLCESQYPSTCALIIRQDGRKYGHWIAVDDGKIIDPELEKAFNVSDYDRRDWYVIRIITEA